MCSLSLALQDVHLCTWQSTAINRQHLPGLQLKPHYVWRLVNLKPKYIWRFLIGRWTVVNHIHEYPQVVTIGSIPPWLHHRHVVAERERERESEREREREREEREREEREKERERKREREICVVIPPIHIE